MNKTVAAVLAAAALLLSMQAVSAECYSDGIRVGTVQKFSRKGLMNKSWEGELVMEGTKIAGDKTGIRGGNVWKFSALDPEVAKVIDSAMMSGHQVALKYCQNNPVNTSFTTQDTPYLITQAVERK